MKYKILCVLIIVSCTLFLGCDSAQISGRYEFREDKRGNLVRLNTATGEASTSGPGTIFPPMERTSLTKIESAELSKITGNGRCLEASQTFEGRLYNGTDVLIRSVGIEITQKKLFLSEETAWKRRFMVRDLYIRPLEVQTFVLQLTGVESGNCEWNITHAYGSPWKPDATWWDRLTQ